MRAQLIMNTSKAISSLRRVREFNPITIATRLFAHRELIWQMASREVGQRYRGSYLGMLWTLITPLAMLLVYTFVFSLVFRSRWQADVETPPGQYALILFAGLSAFNLLSEVVNRAPTLILSNPNFVKKVVFPLEILPVVAIVSALVNSLISVGLVIIGSILVLGHISSTIVLLPLAYVPLILMVVGLAWFLSALGVYVRDIGPGISILVQMLFFVSPIFFPVAAAPEWIRPAYTFNPLSFILESFRQTLVFDGLISLQAWAAWSLFSALVALMGYLWFMRTKRGFADVM